MKILKVALATSWIIIIFYFILFELMFIFLQVIMFLWL